MRRRKVMGAVVTRTTVEKRASRVARIAHLLTLSAAVLVMGTPADALAGGLEIPAPGTRAVGRGGAVAARTDNPMSLFYNPAGLAYVPGIQLTLQTHLTLFNACFNREGGYGDGPLLTPDETRFGNESNAGEFSSVCNSGRPTIVPNLVLSWKVHERVGLSLGLLAPSGVGVQQWGESQRIGERTYEGIHRGLPAPSRYLLIEEELITAFPTVGVGVAVHPRLSLGASFGWGIASFGFTNITRALPGEDFDGDVHTEFTAQDFFVPRVTLSAHATPIDNLDVSFTAIWTDRLRASGDLNVTSGYYRDTPLDQNTISGTQLNTSIPLQLLLGIRYAHRLSPRDLPGTGNGENSGQIRDSMSEELFDIELDVMYERNSSVDELRTNLPTCGSRAGDRCSEPPGPGEPRTITNENGHVVTVPFLGELPLPDQPSVAQQWRDQLSIRLGGDINILPGRFAARLGFTYETRGVTDGFQQLNFMPFQRFGVHLGATVRFNRFDLSLGFGHLFQQTQTVGEEGDVRQVAADRLLQLQICESEGGSPESCDESVTTARGTVVNRGRITSSYTTFSLGLTYHFR
ncbi:MAG: hypothetical protein AAF938_14720 [Myxococcota bacterium]